MSNPQVHHLNHTPAPWRVHDGGRFGGYGDAGPSVCAMNGKNLCQPLFSLEGPADVDQCRANARLVTNAPAMLAALNELAEILQVPASNQRFMQVAGPARQCLSLIRRTLDPLR